MHNDKTNALCDAQPEALTALARVVEDAAERAATAAIERQAGYVAALERRLAAAREGAERAQRISDVGADRMHALRAANEAQQIAGEDVVGVSTLLVEENSEIKRVDLQCGRHSYQAEMRSLAPLKKGHYAALLLLYRKGDV